VLESRRGIIAALALQGGEAIPVWLPLTNIWALIRWSTLPAPNKSMETSAPDQETISSMLFIIGLFPQNVLGNSIFRGKHY
jgi:hypothetical protein